MQGHARTLKFGGRNPHLASSECRGDIRSSTPRSPTTPHGWRLDRALAAAVPTLSRERLKALISSGAVLGPRRGLVRDPAAKAVAGGTYEVTRPRAAARA